MIRSMTGFGKAEAQLGKGRIYVEIRSLNGKTADIGIKTQLLPKDKEMDIRKMLSAELVRGNIDLFISYIPDGDAAARTVSAPVVESYYRQITEIASKIGLGAACGDTVLGSILRMPDVVDMKPADIIDDGNWPVVESCISEVVRKLNEFREKEGAVLHKDIAEKVARILSCVDEIEKHEAERTAAIKEKILSRFAEVGISPDHDRLEAEMIYYLEKLDINEEKVRLRQHCRYFTDTASSDPFPGRKLGFIAQEMGREINTTGSKANNSEIQKIVVRMKDELEKIKEQALNIL